MMIILPNKKLLVLLSMFFCASCFSQTKIYTEIQQNKTVYPGKDYTFDKVIDARANKDNIGIVYKSDIQQEYLADLRDPVDAAFLYFLNNTFPNGSSTVKITMVINELEIGHILSGRRKDSGFVKVNFDFYKAVNDASVLIHHYEGMLVDVSDNIALTHSNRMKRITLMSVAKLDSIVASGATYIETAKPGADSLLKDPVKISAGFSKERLEETKRMLANDKSPRRIMFMIGGHAVFCTENQMYGVNANLLFGFKKAPRNLLGFNANYSLIKFQTRSGLAENIEYQLRSGDLGLRFLRQIKNPVFFNFNPHLMFGKETFITYNTTTVYVNGVSTGLSKTTKEKSFYGLQIDTGIYLLSPKSAGAYMGFDFVLRFTTSYVFESDMGIKLNLGIAF